MADSSRAVGFSVYLAVKFLPQLWINQVVNLLSTLQLKSTVPPGRSEFFESWAFTILLVLDGLHIMLSQDVVDNPLFVQEDLIVVRYQILHTNHRLFSRILQGIFSEIIVHCQVEVSAEKMGPELV